MKQLERTYKVGDKLYQYDPEHLKFLYNKFINCSDKEFVDSLPDVLHFACYVSWVKEVDVDLLLSDSGLIHELVHLLKPGTKKFTDLSTIRKKFEEILIM